MRDGVALSLARNLGVDPAPEMPNPVQHHMTVSGDALDHHDIPGYQGTGDFLGAHVHGLGISHVDACSVPLSREEPDVRRAPAVRRHEQRRARTNTVKTIADGIVGRGVLLDIVGLRGVPFLQPDEYITLEDLEPPKRARESPSALATS